MFTIHSCHIGGNIATNAGGLRLLRYGSLHGSVLGLEAVLADGTVVSTLPGLRKDNTGIDVKQLFIGSEGILGVITAATVQLAVLPKAVNVLFVGCNSFGRVLDVLKAAKSCLGEILSAFEFLDSFAMDASRHNLHLRSPIATDAPFYVLIETHGSSPRHDREKVDALLEQLLERQLVTDGTVAQDEKQAAEIWEVRESMALALKKEGLVYKYDLSLPHSHFYRIVEETRKRVTGTSAIRCAAWGHIGDGLCCVYMNEKARILSKNYDIILHTYVLQTYIHTTYVRTYVHAYMHTYILQTYIRTYVHTTYIHTYIRTYVHTFVHTNISSPFHDPILPPGNVHLNVSVPQHDQAVLDRIEPFVYEFTSAAGGSISAEHGLGQLKAQYIGFSKTPATIQVMRSIKQTLDPNGILNPYKTVL